MERPPSRRERKKDQKRQALLDVASKLIAERGMYATRVEDITERSDLGKGAFYNYFDSKEALIAELVAQGTDVLHRDYLSDRTIMSKPDRVAAVIAAHEAFFADHPGYTLLFHQARGLATMKHGQGPLTAVFAEYLRRTSEVMVSADERARLEEAELIDIAAIVLGAIAGYRSFRLATGLAPTSSVVTEALVAGIPALLAARVRHDGPK